MNKKSVRLLIVMIALVTILAGCGKQQAGERPPTPVRTLPVIKRDTAVEYEFVGEVMAQQQAQIRAKVSGMIVNKQIKGGQQVTAGQPLFSIDNRQYEAAALSAQAQLANARAAQLRSQRNYERYETLVNQGAISQQQFDNQTAEYRQLTAQTDAMAALAERAQIDLSETVVRSPISGKLDTKDLNIGTYVTAGQTVLVTVSGTDPMLVKFNMSENEYLKLKHNKGTVFGSEGVSLRLSDGSLYSHKGTVAEVDSGFDQTGAMTMKAIFVNEQGLLLPGMFARIITPGEYRTGALLVPQKAVQEQLDKFFVSVVDGEKKAQLRPVTVGPRVGNLWIIESGLQEGDQVIVEGFQKVAPGAKVNPQGITLEELYPGQK